MRKIFNQRKRGFFMDYGENVMNRRINLIFANNAIAEAVQRGRKLTVGERIFIVGAAKEGLEIPYRDRHEDMDHILFKFLDIGVLDYRKLGRDDAVVDEFYRPGCQADLSAFSKM
jgi:hypothetical protein